MIDPDKDKRLQEAFWDAIGGNDTTVADQYADLHRRLDEVGAWLHSLTPDEIIARVTFAITTLRVFLPAALSVDAEAVYELPEAEGRAALDRLIRASADQTEAELGGPPQ